MNGPVSIPTLPEAEFEKRALEIFARQAVENEPYRQFLCLLGKEAANPESLADIPFLPVSFFKTHRLLTGDRVPETWFESSGTTGQVRSRHYIPDLHHYHQHTRALFESCFGPVSGFRFLGLLPGYLENPHSSLISMVQFLAGPEGACFAGLDVSIVRRWISQTGPGRKNLVFGVTYALLQLADLPDPPDFSTCILVETGGMKGLGAELCREEILDKIRERLRPARHWTEYGMTELQSQAYAPDGVWYQPNASLRALVRDPEDPFSVSFWGRGALNLVDLANSNTQSFLATDDLGEVLPDGRFRVFGRLDQSEVRGCNLLFAR